ncbi:hypothetical protein AB0K09_00080 [Streptomyces sp. NPDC049577]|uniref:hypothetical protein n=1 Tax=Streptomyces sp. NPDC049577 TaxID=3155153 RepID=UPI00343008AC
MHMNSAPHLLAEDRPEFERVLDQALRAANHDPELAAAIGKRLNTEQLRTMAIGAMTAISSCAMTEYRNYVEAREELRARSAAVRPGPEGGEPDHGAAPGPESAPSGYAPEAPGAGAGAVLVVLAPVLAGIAALLFLIIGYAMRTVGSDESVAGPMIAVGWWFGGLTAAGVLIATTGILLTALRNGRGADPAPDGDPAARQADRAREAWRQALLERGILPFLREALASAPAATPPRSYAGGQREGLGRTPQLGYTRPGFSVPERDPSPTRPRFTSPDYTSPEYGGPEHHPE